jgi:small subunit ribosomal protein S17
MAEKNRKTRTGRVVSDKMEKTVVVSVRTTKVHPLYKKRIRRSTNFMAHDEKSQAHTGDVVRIVESRPYSKMKHWRVVEVLESKLQASPVSEIAQVGADVLEPKPAEPAAAAASAAAAEPELAAEAEAAPAEAATPEAPAAEAAAITEEVAAEDKEGGKE